ncbi:hypothetical protein Anas_14160 [Armadillidium nasatum]|uniref:Uncharacterized protein n=1 Tax=Armadillidium nasatum TaxID=96803 RepID=A0A5N5T0M9_9CRUS|nr:hypothetical protein Anas_14160 [Armadillidium nasatum]
MELVSCLVSMIGRRLLWGLRAWSFSYDSDKRVREKSRELWQKASEEDDSTTVKMLQSILESIPQLALQSFALIKTYKEGQLHTHTSAELIFFVHYQSVMLHHPVTRQSIYNQKIRPEKQVRREGQKSRSEEQKVKKSNNELTILIIRFDLLTKIKNKKIPIFVVIKLLFFCLILKVEFERNFVPYIPMSLKIFSSS